jgi:hypothetical protein
MANKRKALALVSGSFTGAVSQRRYFIDAGKEVTEQMAGDWTEGLIGTYLELRDEQPEEKAEQEPKPTPEPKTAAKKKK